MATGGTGDVLTGMIAAWLAQLLDAEAACKLAVYLHGLAGDLAEAAEGGVAMTAACPAQTLDSEAASKLAVYLHGLAGVLAEADEGEVPMTAADVAGRLGD